MTNHLETMFLDFERKVISPYATGQERNELYGAFVAGVHSFLAELLDQGDAGVSDVFLDNINAELWAFTESLRIAAETNSLPPAPARA